MYVKKGCDDRIEIVSEGVYQAGVGQGGDGKRYTPKRTGNESERDCQDLREARTGLYLKCPVDRCRVKVRVNGT